MKILRNTRLALIALLLVLCTLFASCNCAIPNFTETTTTGEETPFGTTTTPLEETTPEIPPEESTLEPTTPEQTTPEQTTPEQTTPEQTTPEQTTPEQPSPTDPFDYNNIPAYSGKLFVEINNNVPYFSEDDYTTKSYETYAPLDYLSRCGVAMACLGRDLMPTSDRESISSVTPSGWVQASYDIVDGKYLYNRSHLIGWQLSGGRKDAGGKRLLCSG